MSSKKPVALVILDGWGYQEDSEFNAIFEAETPNWDKWWSEQPHTLLEASGQSVGLPDQQMGNSEVGHMHIGAGRILPQDFTKINQAIENQTFGSINTIDSLLADAERTNHTIHVLGLLSPGGVHSHENHLFEFLKTSTTFKHPRINLHLFLDGRDTPPQSCKQSLKRLELILDKNEHISICSISGRYYAMDRDNRWDRIEPVYRLLTQGVSEYQFDSVFDAIDDFYQQGVFDEFIPPTRIKTCKPVQTGDSIFFFNFRADRARQLSQAFLNEAFDGFPRVEKIKLRHFVTMTKYSSELQTEIVFPPVAPPNTLGEVISNHGLSQLRAAETEKYAHVTFFFNGGVESTFLNEKRTLVPSPNVATYDLCPEMNAPLLTQALTDSIEKDEFDVIICNYANADMVGHTGNFDATKKAISCLDHCLGTLYEAIRKKGGMMLITADHGNAEMMFDKKSGQAQTAHTSFPVPLLFLGQGWAFNGHSGDLTDIAPTMLQLLGLSAPPEMTGRALMRKI